MATCAPTSTAPGPLDSVTLLDLQHLLDIAGGAQGPPGPQGPAGAPGATGPQGPQGNTGTQGPVGPAGTAGAVGAQGPQGATGTAGSTGAQGPTGPTGPQGPKGDQGTSVVIKGSVANASLLPSTGLTAGDGWITEDDGHLHVWSGSAWTDVGVVRGPQGPAGPTGPTGATGAAGPATPGPQGPQGPEGPQGIQGNTGAQGPKGDKGDKGDTGATGATGPAVAPGSITNAEISPTAGIEIGKLGTGKVFGINSAGALTTYVQWSGTQAAYDAITTKDPNTFYFAT